MTHTKRHQLPISEDMFSHQLSRDGVVIYQGTESECWKWLHDNTSCSASHAVEYEGYKIERRLP
jgi:hypothetical protein